MNCTPGRKLTCSNRQILTTTTSQPMGPGLPTSQSCLSSLPTELRSRPLQFAYLAIDGLLTSCRGFSTNLSCENLSQDYNPSATDFKSEEQLHAPVHSKSPIGRRPVHWLLLIYLRIFLKRATSRRLTFSPNNTRMYSYRRKIMMMHQSPKSPTSLRPEHLLSMRAAGTGPL